MIHHTMNHLIKLMNLYRYALDLIGWWSNRTMIARRQSREWGCTSEKNCLLNDTFGRWNKDWISAFPATERERFLFALIGWWIWRWLSGLYRLWAERGSCRWFRSWIGHHSLLSFRGRFRRWFDRWASSFTRTWRSSYWEFRRRSWVWWQIVFVAQ